MTGYRITSRDRDVVDEFRQFPIGPHSPDLQRVLNAMRGASNAGKYCLICTKPYAEWQLARMSGRRGVHLDRRGRMGGVPAALERDHRRGPQLIDRPATGHQRIGLRPCSS